jgi:HEAT repeat protein
MGSPHGNSVEKSGTRSSPQGTSSGKLLLVLGLGVGLLFLCLSVPVIAAGLWFLGSSRSTPVAVKEKVKEVALPANPAANLEVPGPAKGPPVQPADPAPEVRPPPPVQPQPAPETPATEPLPALPGNLDTPYNGKPLKEWIAMLSSPDVTARLQGLEGLRLAGPNASSALPQVCSLLHEDKVPEVRRSAATVLVAMGPWGEPAVPALIRGAEDPDSKVRSSCMLALKNLGPAASSAAAVILKAMKDPVTANRALAATALGQIGADPAVAVPALIQALEDPLTQTNAAQALYCFGPDAKPAMRPLMEYYKKEMGPDKGLPIGAVRWMGVDAATMLGEHLADADPNVRTLAIFNLEKMATDAEPAMPALRRALRDDNRAVYSAAQRCLSNLGVRASPAIPDLIALLADPKTPAERIEKLLATIQKIGLGPGDVDRLLPLTKDGPPALRTAAVRALAAGGDDALQQLTQMQRSDDNVVKTAANQAMPEAQRQQEVRRLRKQIESPDAVARVDAGIRMLQTDSQRVEAVPILSAALRDRNVPAEVRLRAGQVLRKAAESYPFRPLPCTWTVIGDFKEALKDPSADVRVTTAEVFRQIEPSLATAAGTTTVILKVKGPARPGRRSLPPQPPSDARR